MLVHILDMRFTCVILFLKFIYTDSTILNKKTFSMYSEHIGLLKVIKCVDTNNFSLLFFKL